MLGSAHVVTFRTSWKGHQMCRDYVTARSVRNRLTQEGRTKAEPGEDGAGKTNNAARD